MSSRREITISTSMQGAECSPAYRPLLAHGARRPAVFVILLAIIVVTVLGMRYAHHDTAGRMDRILDTLIRTHIPRDQPLMGALVNLGDPPHVAILVAAVAGAAAAARRWSGVLLTIAGTLVAVMTTELILKPIIGRLSYGHLSFPSGHITAVASVATATAILLSTAQRPRSVALRLAASLGAPW